MNTRWFKILLWKKAFDILCQRAISDLSTLNLCEQIFFAIYYNIASAYYWYKQYRITFWMIVFEIHAECVLCDSIRAK